MPADIDIPDIEDDLMRRLELRAAMNGRSVEDEARAILVAAALDGLQPISTGAHE
ncbi:FitA-like ribbon-helix-helix domain-containing protein [Brevundimonas sp.]|jgi:plasmid stability protein|uniref:FitA-like ribbon-helix-helix domain-containing protein n=1 Tax=Brevundimonas sp. TaxID=1871086 RepID=UPI00378344A6